MKQNLVSHKMSRHSKKAQDHPSLAPGTLVLDNGAYTIKAGLASAEPSLDECKTIPNCIARSRDKKAYVGSQLSKCDDFAEMVFRRPLENGFVLNWAEQKAIWERTFFDSSADVPCDPQETNLILTEAPNCLQSLQVQTDQMVFEEFEFASCYRCIAPSLNAHNNITTLFGEPAQEANGTSHTLAECLLVVDSGYSHTTVTPLLYGRPVQQAIRRLDVGGKFLTNAYKEMVSTQHTALWDETVPTTEMKEANSFISDDFRRDLGRTWKVGSKQGREFDYSLVVDWVLPDYDNTKKGYALAHDPKVPLKARTLPTQEPVIPLASERFQVPELLFTPSDVGLTEGGLTDMVMDSLEQLPQGLWPAMLANVLLVGGNMNIKGVKQRLESELRQRTPSKFPVRVAVHPEPEKASWLGGACLANNEDLFKQLVVTKQEYMEYGHTMNHAWTNRQLQARANAVAAALIPDS